MSRLFPTIVADPPWSYDDAKRPGSSKLHRPNSAGTEFANIGSAVRYGSMSMDELKALRVKDVAATDAHLYLWTTNAFICEAHDLARSWGFAPKTVITWTKVKPDGTPSMKMGRYYRGATEHIVFAVRGKQPLRGQAAPTAILSPRLPHSVKPEGFYQMVEEQSPGPYLEMFARRMRLGWSAWGDQVPDAGIPLAALAA